MPTFPVSAQKNENLKKRMSALGIREGDFEESFVHSSGPGGQNVNKVATCVVLIHKPTGMRVKCQRDRSQAMNRYFARKLLVLKIEADLLGKQSAKAKRIAKIKRQKRKRSKRAKEKMLEAKRKQSSKKELRKKVLGDE